MKLKAEAQLVLVFGKWCTKVYVKYMSELCWVKLSAGV